MWIAARFILALAAAGLAALAGFLANLADQLMRAPDWQVATLIAILWTGPFAMVALLLYRGPWGALLVIAQVAGLFALFMIVAGRPPWGWLTTALIATLLLAIAVAWEGWAMRNKDPGVA